MEQRSRVAWVCLAAMSILAACGRKEGGPDATIAQDGELSGEVFIVTRSGPSIKLGLVTVVAYREKDILAFIEDRKIAGTEVRADLAPKIESAEKNLVAAEQELAAARSASKPSQNNSSRASYLKCPETADTIEQCRDESRKQFERDTIAWRDRIAGAEGALEARQDILKKLRELSALTKSSQYYFIDMPPGFATAKTNADGLFSMPAPKNSRFAVAAKATRQVFGEPEEYYWLVWVTLGGQARTRIMLSNDNMTTSDSSESVISIPASPP